MTLNHGKKGKQLTQKGDQSNDMSSSSNNKLIGTNKGKQIVHDKTSQELARGISYRNKR
jgi:phage gpG-like protein